MDKFTFLLLQSLSLAMRVNNYYQRNWLNFQQYCSLSSIITRLEIQGTILARDGESHMKNGTPLFTMEKFEQTFNEGRELFLSYIENGNHYVEFVLEEFKEN